MHTEDKILLEKELKETMSLLAKMQGYVVTSPQEDGNTVVEVHACFHSHSETFHSYENNPIQCTMKVLRDFFASGGALGETILQIKKAS